MNNIPDKVSINDVLQELRKSSIAEEKAFRKTCLMCRDAVDSIVDNSKNIMVDLEALREMERLKSYKTRMKDGFTYTRDDLEARIIRNKCNIEKNLERYITCCKEGKLPKEESFRC